jgi:hypothetical protein
MKAALIEDFEKKILADKSSLTREQQKSRLYGWMRFFVFLISLYTVYKGLYDQEVSYFLWSFLSIAVYSLLFSVHQKVKYRVDLKNAKSANYQLEIERLQGQFAPERNGSAFINEQHAYSYDLDLFGSNSLYHHINRLEIPAAENRLAETLTTPLDLSKALQRQQTISSLSDQDDWRANWQAVLQVNKPKKKVDVSTIDFPSDVNKLVTWISVFLTVATISLIAGSFIFQYSFSIALGILPFNMLLLSYNHRRLLTSDQQLGRLNSHIKQYMEGFNMIKSLSDNSEELATIKKLIVSETAPAWKKLAQIIYYLDSRDNFMYWIINPLLFLDTWLVLSLYRWGQKYGTDWGHWIAEIEWMDCMVSLAGYAKLHTDYNLPNLSARKGLFRSENLGHPLIDAEKRVSNSFQFESENVVLLTGSNMSGKSTFLRTVAINHLMAWIGLPVVASRLDVGPAQIFTSMRTTDDLNESTSSFYAELKRIKQLLSRIEEKSDQVILYFLDEILKGTNSRDRHSGAIGLIQQLLPSSAVGFISTHDLELAYHYQDHTQIKNYSFNSQLKNNQLIFDYKLAKDICHSTNASELMRQMGIIRDAGRS